ncbi:MAG: VTT domain-containing protein [Pseudonocardiaceae bacterium]
MEWIALIIGVCLVSALVPVVNAELFLVGLVIQQPQLPWWLVGLAAAVGQLIGKLVFYYAGRGALRLPARRGSLGRLRRKPDPALESRWAARLARFQQTCRDRPIWSAGVLVTSAGVGVPPFAATSLVAGAARIPLGMFVVTGLVGRFARFSAIAVSPGLLGTWWF